MKEIVLHLTAEEESRVLQSIDGLPVRLGTRTLEGLLRLHVNREDCDSVLRFLGRQQMIIPDDDGGSGQVLLGDRISKALSKIGVTEERVTEWLGFPCGCPERREKLNALGKWAVSAVKDSFENAVGNLESLTGIRVGKR